MKNKILKILGVLALATLSMNTMAMNAFQQRNLVSESLNDVQIDRISSTTYNYNINTEQFEPAQNGNYIFIHGYNKYFGENELRMYANDDLIELLRNYTSPVSATFSAQIDISIKSHDIAKMYGIEQWSGRNLRGIIDEAFTILPAIDNLGNIRVGLIPNLGTMAGRETALEKMALLNFCFVKWGRNVNEILLNILAKDEKELQGLSLYEKQLIENVRDKFLDHVCKHFASQDLLVKEFINEVFSRNDVNDFTYMSFGELYGTNRNKAKWLARCTLEHFLTKTKGEEFWNNFLYRINRTPTGLVLQIQNENTEPINVGKEKLQVNGIPVTIHNAHIGANRTVAAKVTSLQNSQVIKQVEKTVDVFLQLILPMSVQLQTYAGSPGSFFVRA